MKGLNYAISISSTISSQLPVFEVKTRFGFLLIFQASVKLNTLTSEAKVL